MEKGQKMKNGTMIGLAIGLCVVAINTGDAVGAPREYKTKFNAKYPAAAENRKVALIAFGGDEGENFTQDLNSLLQNTFIDGEPYFTVLGEAGSRSATKSSGQEGAAAIAYGRNLGAEAVYLGTASVTIRDIPREESKEVCLARTGGVVKQCAQSEVVKVSCRRIEGTYTVAPKVIRVADGKVVYSESISVSDSIDKCDENTEGAAESLIKALVPGGELLSRLAPKSKPKQTAAPITPESMLVDLRKKAAQQISRHIAPYNGTVKVDFKEKGADIPKAAQAQFKAGLEFAKAGRADRACGIWDALNTSETAESPTLLYNLGACAEVLEPDSPRQAMIFYSKADAASATPDPQISTAMTRLQSGSGR